ncbi:MAG: amidase, partial [Calditrichaeota bacterium]|nr:amidase [Calditrichota bacterium]
MRLLPLLFILIACRPQSDQITSEDIKSAEKIAALNFTDQERDSLIETVQQHLKSIESIRNLKMNNSVVNSLQFNPIPMNTTISVKDGTSQWSVFKGLKKPENMNDLAFYSIGQLAELIRTQKINSVELTRFFIDRLKRLDTELKSVITITENRAMEQAARADEEIRNGKYRGLLHGIPYGAKDLLAVDSYKTTWGAAPYKDQVLNET